MATYFSSKAPSCKQSRRSSASLAECTFDDAGDEDAPAGVGTIAAKNEEAKAALLTRHAAEAYKWLLPLRSAAGRPLLPPAVSPNCCLFLQTPADLALLTDAISSIT